MRVHVIKEGAWTVGAACEDDGTVPLLAFLNALPAEQRATVVALLGRVAQRGPDTFREEICHKLRGKIWQFRSGAIRILWFYHGRKVVVCSHGFVKKSEKTPPGEIDRAEKILAALEK